MRRAIHLALSVATLFLSGCATIGTVQTAETNGAGRFQGAIEPAYVGVVSAEGSGGLAYFNLSGRYGVSERVDIGGRLGTSGIELTAKFMLTDPSDLSGPIVSIAPSAGGFFLTGGNASAGIFNVQVPVLIGFPVGEHQFILGPKFHSIFAGAGSRGDRGGVFIGSLGSSFGFSAKVGSQVRLLPEVAFVVPFIVSGATSDGGSETITRFADGAIVQVSFGILFGGRPSDETVPQP